MSAQQRMRQFHLTIAVYGPIADYGEWEMPETFEGWLRQAFGDAAVDAMPALATTLVSVTELRYPLADDMIKRRSEPFGMAVRYD